MSGKRVEKLKIYCLSNKNTEKDIMNIKQELYGCILDSIIKKDGHVLTKLIKYMCNETIRTDEEDKNIIKNIIKINKNTIEDILDVKQIIQITDFLNDTCNLHIPIKHFDIDFYTKHICENYSTKERLWKFLKLIEVTAAMYEKYDIIFYELKKDVNKNIDIECIVDLFENMYFLLILFFSRRVQYVLQEVQYETKDMVFNYENFLRQLSIEKIYSDIERYILENTNVFINLQNLFLDYDKIKQVFDRLKNSQKYISFLIIFTILIFLIDSQKNGHNLSRNIIKNFLLLVYENYDNENILNFFYIFANEYKKRIIDKIKKIIMNMKELDFEKNKDTIINMLSIID